MKILVVSDSHKNTEALENLANMYKNVDLYLHLGDSEDYDLAIAPFESVQGNCDYYFDYPEKRIIPTEQGNILAVHKPPTNNEIIMNNIDIILNGHTHCPKIMYENNRLFLNPGSLAFPRSHLGTTFMILDISSNNIIVSLYSYPDQTLIETQTFSLKN